MQTNKISEENCYCYAVVSKKIAKKDGKMEIIARNTILLVDPDLCCIRNVNSSYIYSLKDLQMKENKFRFPNSFSYLEI